MAVGSAPKRWRSLLPIVGAVLGVVAGAAVVIAIVDTWDQVREALAGAAWGWVVAGLVIAAGAMTSIALAWRHAVVMVGGGMSRSQAVVWYFVGEIGKYLPGGVWPVLGRSELARRSGMAATASYGGVVVSLGALYLCAVLVAAVTAVLAGSSALLVGMAAAAVVAGVGALHPTVTALGARLLRRFSGGRIDLEPPSWRTALGLVGRYVPTWALLGTATWCVARAFDPDVGLLEVWSAATAAWIVGFLAVPVPGGVGVREAVFLALAPGLSTSVTATVAVTARLMFMVVDGLGAAIGATQLRAVRPRTAPGTASKYPA